MKPFLVIALAALMLSGCATKTPLYASRPVGDGDPDAIRCYAGLENTSRLHHKQCKSNAEWARVEEGIRSQTNDAGFVPSLNPTPP